MPKSDYQIFFAGLCLSLSALSNETLIESSVPEENNNKNTYLTEPSDKQQPTDTSSLFHIPGLTVTDSNGPLGQSEIKYRGLGGMRFKIDLEGLALNNPLTGFSDANAMFLFAAQELQATDQSLSISLPVVDHAFARGLIGYGSHNSFKLGASAGTPLGKYSSIFAASQFITTNGNFVFSDPDLPRGPDNIFYRENNDQHRYQALIKFQHQAPSLDAHVLAAFNSHEGGFPGFAFSPTKNLRNRAIFGGLSMGLSKKINKAEFKFSLNNSVFDFQNTDISEKNNYLSSTHEFKFSINNLSLPSWLSLELGQILVLERSYDQNHTRLGGGMFIKRQMRFSGKLKPTLSAYFNMTGYANHGLLFKKDFDLTIQPTPNISLSVGFTRNQRLPTFMELYANNRFLASNENLKKESIWDFQLGSTMRFGEHTRLQVNGFWGYLSDLIVYEPFMATKVRPKNIDTATRYGLDLSLNYEPLTWLALETKNSLLRTKVKATNASLPHSPWFLGLTRLRLGPEEIASLSIQARYRGPSNANDYGTKTTKGYILLDALLSGHIAKLVTLSLSVTNILNTKNARDTYEMPLPGTVIFGQIEVGN